MVGYLSQSKLKDIPESFEADGQEGLGSKELEEKGDLFPDGQGLSFVSTHILYF